MKPAERIGILESLADTLAAMTASSAFYAAINTSKFIAPKRAPNFAFALLRARSNWQSAIPNNPHRLDDDHAISTVRDFPRFRARATPVAQRNLIRSPARGQSNSFVERVAHLRPNAPKLPPSDSLSPCAISRALECASDTWSTDDAWLA